MLKELIISDFAIIERLELSLGEGLTCLTGETGAGKSILVDALSILLGGKTAPEYLRAGREAAVEGAFDVSGLAALHSLLRERGLGGEGELILRRVFSQGRGKAYVNGSLVNVSTLQELGELLVDIHGQHEHQSLLRVDRHLDLLDEYCGLSPLAHGYAETYSALSAQSGRLHELARKERERAQRLDLLHFQRAEIDAAAPVPGEEEALKDERARLMHADRLKALAASALEALREAEVSAVSLLGGARKDLREMAALMPPVEECAKLVESAEVSVREASSSLREFSASFEADPARLSGIEERLDTLGRLRKKYGETLGEVLAYRAKVEEELSLIEDSEQEIAGLKDALGKTRARLMETGAKLTSAREAGAKRFSKRVEAELAGLGMEKARFDVSFKKLGEPGA
ncbi:MAG TPA: AAA family ATPase, partial [Nitrospirota bacterium]|nr:AAA family ATPase [Nitrospirota bacterium]